MESIINNIVNIPLMSHSRHITYRVKEYSRIVSIHATNSSRTVFQMYVKNRQTSNMRNAI